MSTMGRNQANVRHSAGAHPRLWHSMLVSEYVQHLAVLGVSPSSVHATLRSVQNCSKALSSVVVLQGVLAAIRKLL